MPDDHGMSLSRQRRRGRPPSDLGQIGQLDLVTCPAH
jgi:hypothetical protein